MRELRLYTRAVPQDKSGVDQRSITSPGPCPPIIITKDAEDHGKTTMKRSSKEVEEYEEEGGGICDEDNNNRVRKKT